MKTISTSIEISAPPEQVWEVLTNFVSYPAWNPFIKFISGALTVGNSIHVRIHPPGGSAMSFSPKLLKVEPQEELRWVGKLWGMGFLFTGEHSFRLEKISSGTKLVHEESFSGLITKLFWSSLEPKTRKGFVAMNEALKKRCEQKI